MYEQNFSFVTALRWEKRLKRITLLKNIFALKNIGPRHVYFLMNDTNNSNKVYL